MPPIPGWEGEGEAAHPLVRAATGRWRPLGQLRAPRWPAYGIRLRSQSKLGGFLAENLPLFTTALALTDDSNEAARESIGPIGFGSDLAVGWCQLTPAMH
jgi:hypothetical protein